MIEADTCKTMQAYIINQQLFSQAYLRELRTEKNSLRDINARYQTIREWREEAQNLANQQVLRQYVGQCFSTLGLSYISHPSHPSSFRLHADATLTHPVGICLFVNDDNIGCTTKGHHYQAQLVKQLHGDSLCWGIVTNGKWWRLCNASLAAPYEIFLEVDLDVILKKATLVEFMLFSYFFGPSAFRMDQPEDNKTTQIGLDGYIKDSEKYTEAIQRYLRGCVESVLQSLCLGFVQDEAADTYTHETLKKIYDNSIYLLYRILFLFYAEARGLLPVHNSDYQLVSLSSIIEEARRYQQEGIRDSDPFSLWKRLTELFVIVDDGRSALGISPYNGGLFDDEKKPYLKAHKIANSHLAPALFALAYMPSKSGNISIDYRDLTERQLGTLYEGLLEYRLNLVTREPMVIRENKGKRTYTPLSAAGSVKRTETILEVNQVYFADDKNERKSSGSYYTPEDVVQYIITHTLLPKLQERRVPLEELLTKLRHEIAIAATIEEQRRLEHYADDMIVATIEQQILSLRILDPAMGSAHFLVAAGQLMTNFIVETLNLTDWPNDTLSSDPLAWKRRVVERCLYGVDFNPLAHELAKLSLWLSSASTGKPLTFLDHHLKVGNSLCGVPQSRLSTLPTSKTASKQDLFQDLRERTIQIVIEDLAKITLLDSENIENVKYKEEVNRSIKDSTQRLRDIANIWLATLFGLQGKDEKPLSQDEYDTLLANVIRNFAAAEWESFVATNRILRDARKVAEDETFFHWELEFADAVVDGKCQFDVIIANPPYVGTSPNQAIRSLYETAKCGDIYAWLFELSLRYTGNLGNVGMIVPLSLMFSRDMKNLRALLLMSEANTYISAFDATRDGIFQPNGVSRNGQRASIVLHNKKVGERYIYTTNLMRWISEERPLLMPSLHYANITALATEDVFPKLGNPQLVQCFERIKSYGRTVGSTIYRAKKSPKGEKSPPPPPLYHLYVSGSARYFITAMPEAVRNTGLNFFSWDDEWIRNVAMVALNSNIFYWLWCILGDGFHVTSDNVESMVIPDVPKEDPETIYLQNALLNAAEECATYHTKWGVRIPNYNFNKRMDILLNIDDWIIRHVAPDLNLPRDIFAQYKSNSFLRPLDISGLLAEEENRVEEDV